MKLLLIAGFADSLLQFRGPLMEALQDAKIEVHVAAPGLGVDSPMRSQLEAKGIAAHDIALRRTGMNPVADLACLLSLWRLMRRIRPEIVLGYTIKPVIYGSLAAWVARVPRRYALITGLGYAFQGQHDASFGRRVVRAVVQKLYALGLRNTHKVFFQNPDDEALFRTLRIIRDHSATQVVNGSGVDIAAFAPVPLPGTPHFLLIGRLLGDKGVREYAEAAALLRQRHPHAVFSLAGWIDENPDAIAQDELDTWVRDGTLHYHGRLSDVRPAIAACAVYVLPSYREGTPRTVLEAMAMGRAIVTTDAPGCRETVVHGKNGYLVKVRSATELAEALERLIESPALIAEMGATSRQMAEQRYDVHKVNAAMLRGMGIPSHDGADWQPYGQGALRSSNTGNT
ncbi:MAG TPA: glycosyltransferase family 4 protein [Burkholderiaceae bacterium]|nr:glycosyltransferase family 4 protein [Burkholderiaceae bacterium]